jgi:plasmid stabilization system protein ParE
MRVVRFHPEADLELVEARKWYAARSEVAAQAFSLTYPAGRRGERRFVLDRFPYTVLYRVREDHIYITAVAHQSRRPGYWQHRR